ncbi:hypothetical protein BV22DRAFT_1024504 [Leucogyrophana mollusca]|uniref:Uncharacterized protein n=1 Tax=Leucogyrophana mollusca TaxID=85980 RepID=A0ACB8AZC8_9AGAM|nr:hypothetical protein BV22DRAFT_1024504 [Leucogyrophana mollusca]
MDEVAINEEAYYDKCRNSIGGLCRDHSGCIDLKATDYDSILHASESVHGDNPPCHYGREATVTVIAAFSQTKYSPLPVLVSPTCKSETADSAEVLIQQLLDCWHQHPDGKARFGPVWCFSTDGDATRRLACYNLFMGQKLGFSSSLYPDLSRLPGSNLQTGVYEITMDFDPKHLVKSACFILRALL